MAYTAFTTAEVAAGKFWTADQAQKVKDDFDFLYGLGAGNSDTLNNASFDIDADGDGDPDNWTMGVYSGGSYSLVAGAHGAYALQFSHPGTGTGVGGGHATSDYLPCDELRPFYVQFLHKNSHTGCDNRIIVKYYDEDKVAVTSGSEDETVYSVSSGNPTSWTLITSSVATPPTAAQYCKIQVIGGLTGTNPSNAPTTVEFDGLQVVDLPYQIAEQIEAGGVGSYVFANSSTSSDVAFGSTRSGSALTPTSAVYKADLDVGGTTQTINTFSVGSTLSGTWMCMGTYDYVEGSDPLTYWGATLWLRIS